MTPERYFDFRRYSRWLDRLAGQKLPFITQILGGELGDLLINQLSAARHSVEFTFFPAVGLPPEGPELPLGFLACTLWGSYLVA